jgi:hypothetical protein
MFNNYERGSNDDIASSFTNTGYDVRSGTELFYYLSSNDLFEVYVFCADIFGKISEAFLILDQMESTSLNRDKVIFHIYLMIIILIVKIILNNFFSFIIISYFQFYFTNYHNFIGYIV